MDVTKASIKILTERGPWLLKADCREVVEHTRASRNSQRPKVEDSILERVGLSESGPRCGLARGLKPCPGGEGALIPKSTIAR